MSIDIVRPGVPMDCEKALNDFHLMEQKATNKTKDCGLRRSVLLKIGAVYRITSNINVGDGLANGVSGKLVHISYGSSHMADTRIPVVLFMVFDDPEICLVSKQNFFSLNIAKKHIKPIIEPNWIPIELKRLTIYLNSLKIDRIQLPITLAHARTFHSSQGMTWNKVIVNLEPFKQLTKSCFCWTQPSY